MLGEAGLEAEFTHLVGGAAGRAHRVLLTIAAP